MPPNSKPPACEACPAYQWGIGFVEPEVPPRHQDLVVIGQGPGEVEASTGRPFHPDAPSGRMLTRWFHEATLQRGRCLFTNVVWCWLPKTKGRGHSPTGNREPTAAEIAYCRNAHWGPLVESLDPDAVVVAVGAPASRALLGVETVGKYIGTMNWRDHL